MPHAANAWKTAVTESPFKSRSGLGRIVQAARYSWLGLKTAWRHEAAFRQELALGIPMMIGAPWLAPNRLEAWMLIASIALVLLVECLNSAIEALADSISLEHHPQLGRAKDLGSAAVLFALLIAAGTWITILWPR